MGKARIGEVQKEIMWVDTHTHFDFSVFDATRTTDWQLAQKNGVIAQFVMSVAPSNFLKVQQLSSQFDNTYFALGIHPLFINDIDFNASINLLAKTVERNIDNKKFIGIGEIGLDTFMNNSDLPRQEAFYKAQLKIARDFDVSVFLHTRKTHDVALKYCKSMGVNCGIAHAFNGSLQQAENYLQQGFKLGVGGAFTYDRATKLQKLIKELPIESFVLETDSPDMPPSWLSGGANKSYQLPRIADYFSSLRNESIEWVAEKIYNNSKLFYK